jgi:putative ABC transport system permease protein
LFTTLGLMPLLGQTCVPDDGIGEAVVVISEGLWLRRLGGDPAAVGRTTTLDGSPHLVVGIVPRDFRAKRSSRFAKRSAPRAGACCGSA